MQAAFDEGKISVAPFAAKQGSNQDSPETLDGNNYNLHGPQASGN